MNLRMLDNFLHVAQIGTINGAAKAANIAQPALTRQMALLEQEFSAQLFHRHARGITLTEAGRQLQGFAEHILSELATARDVLSETVSVPSGSLSLGLPTSMRYVLSTKVISTFRTLYPNVALKVHEALGHVIDDLMNEGKVDVAIVLTQPSRHGLEFEPLATEDVYLVGPADAPLNMANPVSIDFLSKLPFILLSPTNQLRIQIESKLRLHNLLFQSKLEVDGQPLALDLVRSGGGYTVLPLSAIQVEMVAGQISASPIRDLTITWAIGVNRLRSHAPSVREMIRIIREVVDVRVANGEWRRTPK